MPHSVESLMTAEEQVRLYLSRQMPRPDSVTSMEVFADTNDPCDFSDTFESPSRGAESLDEADIGNSKPQPEPPENMVWFWQFVLYF